jgi:hypothetical protein
MNWLFGGLSEEIASLTVAIRGLAMSNRKPVFWVRLSFQEPISMALVYSVTAGSPVDADVTSRELTVVVNGESVGGPVSFNGTATDLGEIKVEQGAAVVLALVDIDDAGNRSQPAMTEFTATDTIPPATPGSFGVSLVREE